MYKVLQWEMYLLNYSIKLNIMLLFIFTVEEVYCQINKCATLGDSNILDGAWPRCIIYKKNGFQIQFIMMTWKYQIHKGKKKHL